MLARAIVDKTFILKGYTLHSSHVKALASTFGANPASISKFILFDCGLKDRDMATLFSAMSNLERIKLVSLRQC